MLYFVLDKDNKFPQGTLHYLKQFYYDTAQASHPSAMASTPPAKPSSPPAPASASNTNI